MWTSLLTLVVLSTQAKATDNTPSTFTTEVTDFPTTAVTNTEISIPFTEEKNSSSTEIYALHVRSKIQYRYATTLIHSKIANLEKTSSEVKFVVVLPESAFISSFLMECKGKIYQANVTEKEEAEKVYQDAVKAGQTAGHVAVSTRNSNTFVVSVNVEARSKIYFNLTYEELLTRRLSLYNHIITLHPSQAIRDLKVDIHLRETRNITSINVTAFGLYNNDGLDSDRSDNLGLKNPIILKKSHSGKVVDIHFAPTIEQQLSRSTNEEQSRQFILKYDVDRSEQPAGEILLIDGYFVHFFAPKVLEVLPKHMIFVLDTSGSMYGRKVEQLKDSMKAIISSLREEDYFSIVKFGTDVEEWSSNSKEFYGITSQCATFKANKINIELAQDYVRTMEVSGGTNIHGALIKALQLAAKQQYESARHESESFPQPIILFLTDGLPTVGEIRSSRILATTRALNTEIKAAVFSLSFGENANFHFLKKLSLQNNGFARKIYEASDASIQLQSFYEEIGSPLLSNVTFTYIESKIDNSSITKHHFHSYYKGSEVIVAGKVTQGSDETNLLKAATAWTGNSNQPQLLGSVLTKKKHKKRNNQYGVLEKLWAYLTIKQLLDQQLSEDKEDNNINPNFENKTGHNNVTEQHPSPKEQALKLALKYGFVTPLTSLVVVKPNSDNPINLDLSGETSIKDMDGMETSQDNNRIKVGAPHLSIGFQGGRPLPVGHVSNTMSQKRPTYPQKITTEELKPTTPATTITTEELKLTTPATTITTEELKLTTPATTITTEELKFTTPATTTEIMTTLTYSKHEETTAMEVQQLSLSDLVWLSGYLDSEGNLKIVRNDSLVENKYVLHNNESLQLNTREEECKTPKGEDGSCKPLVKCILADFKDSYKEFLSYFCPLDKYAGVCCPNYRTL